MQGALHRGRFCASLALVLTLTGQGARAGCDAVLGPANPDERYEIKRDYVIDQETGLEWARCVFRMAPFAVGDRCVGTPRTLALERYTGKTMRAPAPHPSGKGWRLPTPLELRTLMDARCSQPAINSTVFPNTPVGRYWAAMPGPVWRRSGDPRRHYGDFATGVVDSDEHWNDLFVRFVRGPVMDD